MRRALVLFVGLSFTTLFSAACGEDFEPYPRLTKLRVLAIKSEPVAPSPGEITTLSTLVYTPPGETATYQWSWCPFPGSANQGYPCAVTEQQLAMLTGMPAPSFQLGTQPTAELRVDAPVAALKALCEPMDEQAQAAAAAGFRLDCEHGFPVQVKLVVTTPTDTLTAVRTVRIALEPDQKHTNPVPTKLVAAIEGTERPLTDVMVPVSVLRNEDNVIRTGVDITAAVESYFPTDDEGKRLPDKTPEDLTFSWFVESGDLDEERTGVADGYLPLPVDDPKGLTDPLRNKWKPATTRKYERGNSRVFVILSDNRGGVGWIEGSALLMEKAR